MYRVLSSRKYLEVTVLWWKERERSLLFCYYYSEGLKCLRQFSSICSSLCVNFLICGSSELQREKVSSKQPNRWVLNAPVQEVTVSQHSASLPEIECSRQTDLPQCYWPYIWCTKLCLVAVLTWFSTRIFWSLFSRVALRTAEVHLVTQPDVFKQLKYTAKMNTLNWMASISTNVPY